MVNWSIWIEKRAAVIRKKMLYANLSLPIRCFSENLRLVFEKTRTCSSCLLLTCIYYHTCLRIGQSFFKNLNDKELFWLIVGNRDVKTFFASNAFRIPGETQRMMGIFWKKWNEFLDLLVKKIKRMFSVFGEKGKKKESRTLPENLHPKHWNFKESVIK